MKFTHYKKNDLREFESRIKNLALEKNYKFERSEHILDKDKILTQSSSDERELLKIFNDKTKVFIYYLKHRKGNYLIVVGKPLQENTMGVYVNYNNKPFKQVGKVLMGLPLITFGGPVGLVLAAGAATSGAKGGFSFKGPLSKKIKVIINDSMGSPVE